MVAGAAVVGVIAAFQSFEQAFAGVARTVEATNAELATIRQGLIDLSKTIPIAANELAEIALVAGQLGIAAKDVVEFTDVAAKLGVVTELSSTEAAEGLARVSQITNTAAEDFDNLASVLVDLGNKFVSTEGDILKLSIRIAGASNVIGIAADDVLGIANAFASIVGPSGLEAAGTAIQKVMLAMLKATREGGKKLDVFAKTAGVTTEQFKKLFNQDPSELFNRFVEGLGKQGKAAIDTLTELELKDARLIRTFLQVAGAGDILRRSLNEANREFEQNIALEREFAKFADTLQSQFKILRNQVFALGIDLGELLKPGLIAGIKQIGSILGEVVSVLRPGFIALSGVLDDFIAILGEGMLGLLRGVSTTLQFFAKVIQTFGPTILELGRILGVFSNTVFAAFSDAIFASGDAIQSIVASFAIFAKFAGDELVVIIQAIADVLPAVTDGLSQLFAIADPVFRLILAQGVPALKTLLTEGIIPAILALAQGLAPVLIQIARLLPELAQELAPVVALLGITLGKVIGDLADPIAQVVKALGRVAVVVGTSLVKVLEVLAPVLGTLLISIANLAEPIATIIQAFAQLAIEILPIVVQVISALLGPLGQLIITVLPILKDLILVVADGLSQLAPIVGQLIVALTPLIEDILVALVRIIKAGVVPLIITLAQTMVDFVKAVGPSLAPLLVALTESIIAILNALTPIIPQIVEGLTPAFIALVEAITPLLPQLVAIITDFLELIAPLLPSLFELITALTTLAIELLPVLVPLIQALFQALGDPVLINDMVTLFQTLTDIILELTPRIVTLVDTLLGTFLTTLRLILEVLSKFRFALPHEVDVGITAALNAIKATGFAGGGSFSAGQSILVGEEGREIVTFGQAGHVTPNRPTERILAGDQRPIEVTVIESTAGARATAFDVATEIARNSTR